MRSPARMARAALPPAPADSPAGSTSPAAASADRSASRRRACSRRSSPIFSSAMRRSPRLSRWRCDAARIDGTILLDPAGVAIDGTVRAAGLSRGSMTLARIGAEAHLKSGQGTIALTAAGAARPRVRHPGEYPAHARPYDDHRRRQSRRQTTDPVGPGRSHHDRFRVESVADADRLCGRQRHRLGPLRARRGQYRCRARSYAADRARSLQRQARAWAAMRAAISPSTISSAPRPPGGSTSRCAASPDRGWC